MTHQDEASIARDQELRNKYGLKEHSKRLFDNMDPPKNVWSSLKYIFLKFSEKKLTGYAPIGPSDGKESMP